MDINTEKELRDKIFALEKKIKQQQLVSNISNHIQDSLILEKNLFNCVTQIRDFIECDRVLIFQFQSDKSGIIIAESVSEKFPSRVGNIIEDSCFMDKKTILEEKNIPIVVNNIYQKNYTHCHLQLLEQYKVKSNVTVPLKIEEDLWGLLIAHQCIDFYLWEEHDIVLLQDIGKQLEIAITQSITYKKLKESEKLYREAQKIAHLSNWEHNIQDKSTYWSDETYNILEFDPQECEVSYEKFCDAVHPDDLSLVQTNYQNHILNHDDYDFVHRLLMKDGRIKYVREHCRTIYDSSGNPLRSFGTMQDITSQKLAQNMIKLIIEGTSNSVSGQEFFTALVTKIGEAINKSHIVVCDMRNNKNKILALWTKEKLLTNIDYDIKDTPCEQVIKNKHYFCYQNLQQFFPNNLFLKEIFAQSYVGISLLDMDGNHLGHLCILDENPIDLDTANNIKNILEIFAPRASAELLRLRKDENLQEINATLEAKIQERTKELESSQQFIKTVIDTIPLPVFWKDKQSIFLGCNEKFAQMINLEYTCDIVGKIEEDFLKKHHQGNDDIVSCDREIITTGKAQLAIEESLILPDGRQRCIETHKAPLKDLDDNIIGLVGMFRDITIEKQIEEEKQRLIFELQQTNNLLNGMTNAQSEFIIGKSRSTIFEDLLSSILDFTHSEYGFIAEVLYTENDHSILQETIIKIREFSSLLSENITNISWNQKEQKFYFIQNEYNRQYDDVNTLFNEVIITGKSIIKSSENLPQKHFCLNGFLGIPLLSNSQWMGILVIANSPQGYNESTIDYLQPFLITCTNLIKGYRIDEQRRLAEENLSKSNQKLIRATRLKDEFLANMSHELRTPLNAILGNAEILLEQIFGKINDTQEKNLKTIENSGYHLLELINDILDVAKIEAGEMKLNINSTSIDHLCQSAMTFVQQQAFKKQIKLTSQISPSLPNLLLDQKRIRQVLINLLNNAVKFTPEGGKITLTIDLINHLEKKQNQPYLRIAITDNGIGIHAENIPLLFKPFIQIDSTLNRQYAGTGLGLALVKQIIELHQGKVGVTSHLGRGSCFYIDLPYCVSSVSSLPTSIITTDSSHGNILHVSTIHSPLILLAEDSEANIITISSYLCAKGYRLIIAHNGKEAITQTKIHNPDLILMDIQMPEMNGLEAIKNIRQQKSSANIPIIVLSALTIKPDHPNTLNNNTTISHDRQLCLDIGANDYISKPVRLKELVSKIEKLIKV